MADVPYFSFDYDQFVALFPVFSDPTAFPSNFLQQNWTNATYYIANNNFGISLVNDAKAYAINLLAAHLTQTNVIIAAGQVPGIKQNATIDKVSLGLTPPPVPNNWRWWLQTTAYGQQLLALLKTASAGGFYAGGLPERDAFRKVYGTFYSGGYPGGPPWY